MKTSKKTGKTAEPKAKKTSDAGAKGRKMEPIKSKELKNQRFDDIDDEDVDPEMMDDNFKNFDEFIVDDMDEDDD
ncbi:hypothetical protein BH11BAC2_BH11BAC2_19190 [soil metagenome]